MIESTDAFDEPIAYIAPLLEAMGDFDEQTQGNGAPYVEGFFSYLGA
ncbi:hypothetical protein [Streptomyces sp. NPDC002044]